MKHRDSIDVICAAVTASHERPRELIVGGRIGPLTAAAAKNLADHLQEPTWEPVWADSIPSGQCGPR